MDAGLAFVLISIIALYWACYLHISRKGGAKGRRFFFVALILFCCAEGFIYTMAVSGTGCHELFCSIGYALVLMLFSYVLVLMFPMIIVIRAMLYPQPEGRIQDTNRGGLH